jgi:hypothetical protein
MPRTGHGTLVRLDVLEAAGAVLGTRDPRMREAFAPSLRADLQRFDFMFPELQADEANLLPTSADTPQRLIALGKAMGEADPDGGSGDSDIPAAYTYFGQFIDHDITLEAGSLPELANLFSPTLTPLSPDAIRAGISNIRTAALDLDSVYGQGPTADPNALVPYDGDKLVIGNVTSLNGQSKPLLRPPGKDDANDLPRKPRTRTRRSTGKPASATSGTTRTRSSHSFISPSCALTTSSSTTGTASRKLESSCASTTSTS